MNLKSQKVQKYWNKSHSQIDYSQIDPGIIKEFKGNYPKVVDEWLPDIEGIFKADPSHQLSRKEKKHRIMKQLEDLFGIELSKKHYWLVK